MNCGLIAVAASCVLMLSSCGLLDPSGTTWVEGQVIENGTGQPVPFAKLSVSSIGNGAAGGQSLPSIYNADAQGHFSFHFEGKELTSYELSAFAEPGYYTAPSAVKNIRGGRHNKNVKVPVLTPSWIRIHLRDDPPRNLTRIYVAGYNGQDESIIYPRDTSYVRSMTGIINGNIWTEIRYESTGQRIRRDWSIVPIPLDTVDLLVAF